jgi:hypothetical protein
MAGGIDGGGSQGAEIACQVIEQWDCSPDLILHAG